MKSKYQYFTVDELSCSCGCDGEMDHEFMVKLVSLRRILGIPFPVTSGFRCPEYNNVVSSSGRAGPHTTGRAVDIAMRGDGVFKVLRMAATQGFTGIGLRQKGGNRFIHLDDLSNTEKRPRPFVWTY